MLQVKALDVMIALERLARGCKTDEGITDFGRHAGILETCVTSAAGAGTLSWHGPLARFRDRTRDHFTPPLEENDEKVLLDQAAE